MIERLVRRVVMNNFARLAALAALALTGIAGSPGRAEAQSCTPTPPEIVCNGGFESPSINGQAQTLPPAGSGPSSDFKWTIGGNSIDLVKNFWQAAEGSQSIDLDGNAPGSISQTLLTKQYRSYRLTFKYSAHPSLGGNPARATMRWGTQSVPIVFAGKSTKSNMGWKLFDQTFQATSTSTVLSFTSDSPSNNNYGIALDAVSAIELPPPLATPVLLRAVARGGTNAYLIGRVDGASDLPISVQAYTSATCTDGALVGGTAVGQPVPVTTDPDGYFGVATSPVTAGYFVTVQVTSPSQTATSTCMATSADNDSWPKALPLADASLLARDFIDVAGRTRWYRFEVKPGQRIQINLSQLPADYDLAVFKDIGAAFLADIERLTTTDPAGELTRLGAEYAPSVFSPSVFSPSVFSPSVFSPDAYAPSVFSPSVFSPSVFSPSVFSPSVFSPSVFSPSVFSPSVFSPSVFSPSVFSPSVFSTLDFSPSVFSDIGEDGYTELAKAFSSAQTRSIIGVSATPGTGDELVVVNSWNNTGNFYVRVAGRAGAYSTSPTATSPTGQFRLDVTKGLTSCNAVTQTALTSRAAAPEAGVKTVILTDLSKLGGVNGLLASKLAAFATSAGIGGVVVDVSDTSRWGTRVGVLKQQAVDNPQCPYAMNLVAEEIKGIVDSYRPNNPGLRYVVIAGNDDAIAFFRYRDESQLGQESGYVPPVGPLSTSEGSLRNDYVLSQDAYGSGTQVSMRTSSFPVPGLAVGRLVETPAEIIGMIDAYLSLPLIDGQRYVIPGSSLVTGYDFLQDAADAVKSELEAGIGSGSGQVSDALITPNGKSPEDSVSWTATQLGTKLFGNQRHDVIFLAGHFSANSALAADFTTSLLTTDLAASTTNFTNAIVFSAGCHSGYNLVNTDAIEGVTEKLDWAQAFAQKGATLIAGTGYQYGDTEFLEYSERLYANFARQLRAGTGAVAVGEALVKAKLDYLVATPDIRGIHEKALLEATLFGLPMLGVNMPGARVSLPATGGVITPESVVTEPAQSLGLKSYDLLLSATDMQVTSHPLNLRLVTPNCNVAPLPEGCTVAATWLSGPAGVVANAAEPALPLAAINVTPTVPNLVLRGVGFRGGSYSDATVVALTGAPTTELRGVHVPFVSPVFYPMRTWNTNHFGSLAGTGGTSLLVTPAQHRAADIALGTSTRRTFGSLDLRLHYSGTLDAAALSDAPTIVRVDAQLAGGGVAFTAQVVGDPLAAIHQVWVTYTSDGANAWTSLDLVQCAAPQPAACGTTEDSSVWKASLPTSPPGLRYVVQAVNGYGLVTLDDNLGAYYGLGGAAQAATTLVLNTPPTAATFGDNPVVTATLTSAGTPLPDKSVIVTVGGAARFGTTGVNGVVAVNLPIVAVPGSYRIVASFGGDATHMGSSASGPFAVSQATTSLSALDPVVVGGIGATLEASLGGPPVQSQRLLQEAVTFTVSGAGGTKKSVAITDYLGRAMLAPTGLPAGTYSIAASFAGNTTYTPATATQLLAIAAQGIIPVGLGLLDTITYPGSATFAVSSTSGQPVTVTLSPDPNSYCTLALNSVTYNGLTNTYTSSYTLTADAPGTCTLVASAAGTTTYASVEVTRNVVIPAIATTTALGSSANPSVFGQPVMLTATVTPASPGLGAATGTVEFKHGASTLGSGPVTVSGGVATLTVPVALAVGSYLITAEYVNADGNFQNSTSNEVRQVVNVAETTTTLAPDSVSAQFGQNVTLTATVAAAAPGAGVPDGGTVTFNGAPAPNSSDVGGGTATLMTNEFAVGTHAVTATFSDNSRYAGSTSAASTVTIARRTTTTALTADRTTVPFGTSITLTATVAPGSANGSVDFIDGTTTLDTVPLSGGTATFTATTLAIGTHSLTARYVGDTNNASSTSAALTVTVTDVFAASGPMLQPRVNHTATLLNDGRVLVTGGYAIVNGAATRTAEIYCPDPYTPPSGAPPPGDWCPEGVGEFSQAGFGNTAQVGVGNMVQARAFHTATLLPDGTVLLAGGFDASGAPTATSEIYDPRANRFTAAGNMPSKSAGHTATLITKNGTPSVFVAGGGNSSSQVFNSASKSWSPSGGMAGQRSYHTATLVGTTKVLLAGGVDNANKTLQTTTIYNIGAGTFVSGPTMLAARERHAASAIANGKVLLAGGRAKTGNNYRVDLSPLAEIYDPSNATTPFVAVSFASGSGRYSHSASALGANGQPDGRVLVTGGTISTVCGQQLATTELFTTAAFSSGAPMIEGRYDHTATVLKDGRVLVAGGRGTIVPGTCGPLDTSEIWTGPSAP